MQWPRLTRRTLAIVGAVCATGLLAAVPAAQATVGGVCKLNTPETPHRIVNNGVSYIVSTTVMWCERDSVVSGAQASLTIGARGQSYSFTARAGQRYDLKVMYKCYPGPPYYVGAKAEFSGPEGYVYNTSPMTYVYC